MASFTAHHFVPVRMDSVEGVRLLAGAFREVASLFGVVRPGTRSVHDRTPAPSRAPC